MCVIRGLVDSGSRCFRHPLGKSGSMLLSPDTANADHDILDQFDNPFVHAAFVQAAEGRICQGPVEVVQHEGYRFGFEATRPYQCLNARVAKFWSHGYGPIGGGFFDPKGSHSRTCSRFQTALDRMQEASGADLIVWPYFPLQSREFGWLQDWISNRCGGHGARSFLTMRRHKRAFLDCRSEMGGQEPPMGLHLSRNKRKTLGRQRRRLKDLGSVQFRSTRDDLELDFAVETFLAVEASGWKARKGTALAVDPKLKAFFEDFIVDMVKEGSAQIDLMSLNQDCIAGLVSFRAGRGLFTWKTGMDEVYKRFSPGVHMLLATSRTAIADPDIDYVDSLADEGGLVAEHLWAGRRLYAQLLIPMNAHGRLAAHSFRATSLGKDAARYWVKRLIGRD